MNFHSILESKCKFVSTDVDKEMFMLKIKTVRGMFDLCNE